MSKPLRHARNISPTSAASTKATKQRLSGGSQAGDQTPISLGSQFGDDEYEVSQSLKKRFQDVEERRLKEWENYQRSHRSSLEQSGAKAYLDFSIADVPAGRLVVELFEDIVPLTVENFRNLVTGTPPYDPLDAANPKRDYIDSNVYHINKKGRYFCLGELHNLNLSSSHSGVFLPDENFAAVRHTTKGILSMVSRGPNTVGSAFSITLDAAPSLDFKQVVFGKVIDGLGVLDKIEAVTTNKVGTPSQPITVTFCGALTGAKPPGVFEPLIRSKPVKEAAAASAAAGHPLQTPPSTSLTPSSSKISLALGAADAHPSNAASFDTNTTPENGAAAGDALDEGSAPQTQQSEGGQVAAMREGASPEQEQQQQQATSDSNEEAPIRETPSDATPEPIGNSLSATQNPQTVAAALEQQS